MVNRFKASLVQSYYFIRYPKARQLRSKGISFQHYRELNKAWLVASNINTVIDVGANVGQFARLAREVFDKASIYSFEPLPDCYEKLRHALPDDKKFFSFNKAIGRSKSSLKFFRSVHSPSSSFLKMEEIHKEAFPESSQGQLQEPIDVEVDALDNIFENTKLDKNILLKIDVQGFENEVIDGAHRLLSKAMVLIIEMSMVKLYQDQPLFHDVYQNLHKHGFQFKGNLAQMLHPVSGEVVQVDAVFVRE